MSALMSQIKLLSRLSASNTLAFRFGTISAYDPDAYAIKVRIQPEDPDVDATGNETGWISLGTQWAGNGWGLVFGPEVGIAVGLLFELGDVDSAIVFCQCFNLVDQPPPVPSGEAWLIHKTQSFLKLTNDGKVAITSHSDLNLNSGGDVNVTASGKVNVSATEIDADCDIKTTGTVTAADFIPTAGTPTYLNHKHSDPQGGDVGTPI